MKTWTPMTLPSSRPRRKKTGESVNPQTGTATYVSGSGVEVK
jgi:hypothetical protein